MIDRPAPRPFRSCCPLSSDLERVAGIEPALSVWKTSVLPLNYTRVNVVNRVGFEPDLGSVKGC